MRGKLAYIGLGVNMGDRLGSLQRAVGILIASEGASKVRVSRVYESPPWGYSSSHPFLNAVVELRWDGTPEELHRKCVRIELALGRERRGEGGSSDSTDQAYSDRVIDLDLLWFECITCSTPQLTLPHPRAHLRAFVLLPWLELAPELELNGQALSAWLGELALSEVAATQAQPHMRLNVTG